MTTTIKFIPNTPKASVNVAAVTAKKKIFDVADLSFEALSLDAKVADFGNEESCRQACLHAINQDAVENPLDIGSEVASIVYACKFQMLAGPFHQDLLNFIAPKSKQAQKIHALFSIAQIATVTRKSSEPFLFQLLPFILECSSDKSPDVCAAAKLASEAIIKISHAQAADLLFPIIFKAMESTGKYPKRVLALQLLMILSKVSGHAVRQNLTVIISRVAECMTDMNANVSSVATETMNTLSKTIHNRDLAKALPYLVDATADYTKVSDCVKILHATTFVRDIDAPALALIIPVLSRSLLERNNATLYRQAAIVVDNICKLIPSPQDVTQFLTQLVPGLERIIAVGADPDLRAVTLNTISTVKKLLEISTAQLQSEKKVQVWAMRFLLKEILDLPETVTNHVAEIMSQLTNQHNFDAEEWKSLAKYFKYAEKAVDLDDLRVKCFKMVKTEKEDLSEQDHEVLCDCTFNLGYGGMMLLKDAHLNLRRGSRYGIVGKNGCGKTTLMRAIANGQLEGFPSQEQVKTVYVSHTFQGNEDEESSVRQVVKNSFENITDEEIEKVLHEFEFTEELQARRLSALSGGWKMKLELAIAMLRKADILLLDEPTNHLDVKNCMWLEKYLNGNQHITVLLVSHDAVFLDNVCTHIIHYGEKKLKIHKCDFSKFVELVPEAKTYLEYDDADFAFNFPNPGNLDGIKTTNRTILRLKDVSFTYPASNTPTLNNINVGISLSSRIAVVGPNGAGKSTMIRIMTGESFPSTGRVQKHASLRLAYVAQHAFHHLEQHLEKSPNAYIRWRYENGIDKELFAKETRKVTAGEQAKKEEKNIECICGRQKLKRSYKYEVKLYGHSFDDTVWVPRERLEELGFKAMIEAYDDVEAARGGNYEREISTIAIERHLEEFGLDPEVGTHGQIKGLSGGQKVKVVLAAAMWLRPHILVMDEPTNYLDVQSLNALSRAISEFKGGIVMISHNSKFVNSCCNEFWEMKNGELVRREGGDLAVDEEMEDSHLVDSEDMSAGNSEANGKHEPNEVNELPSDNKAAKPKKPTGGRKLTRKEKLAKEKIRLAKLYKYGPKADGTEYSSDEEVDVQINVGSIN